MRTVEDASGDRYILLKESDESSLVRNPGTGEREYLTNDEWTTVEGTSPLEAAADAVPDPVTRVLTAVPNEEALGLLLEIDARGPVGVRALLEYDLCESDVHGLLAEFRAAGLVTEESVGGERGYDTTGVASRGLAALSAD